MFIAVLFTIIKTWNQPKCINSGLDNGTCYTMHYYKAMKKDEIKHFEATWMALEAIILSKLRQEQKTKYHVFSLISGSKH